MVCFADLDMMMRLLIFSFLCSGALVLAEPVPMPEHIFDMLLDNCMDCHDDGLTKGGVNVDRESIDWSDPKQRDMWERVLKVTRDGVMPPMNKPQPTLEQRREVIAYIDQQLYENTDFGKQTIRRLSNREYQATIQNLFNMPKFELEAGFPKDHIVHGFDNQHKGLQLSAPLMHAYISQANTLADLYFEKKSRAYEPLEYIGYPAQMTQTFSSSEITDDGRSLLLASRHAGQVFRATSWSSDLEIMRSGVYEVMVSSSQFKPKSDVPMILELRARGRETSDRTRVTSFRMLKTFEVTKSTPEIFKFTAELHKGETILFRWANSEFDHTFEALKKAAIAKFEKDRRYHAAWLELVYPQGKMPPDSSSLRGLNGHLKVQALYKDPNLDVSDATFDSERNKKLFNLFRTNDNAEQGFCDTWNHYIFENGPCLQIHGLKVVGPSKIVDSPAEIAQQNRRLELLDKRREGEGDMDYAKRFFERFLSKAFRVKVDAALVDTFVQRAQLLWDEGNSFDQSMHFLLRSVLKSPRFLFRDLNHETPEYDLAARLSYFLTNGPPDAALFQAAIDKTIFDNAELEEQVMRLLPKNSSHPFVKSFPKQWLNTRSLDYLMPDTKHKFSDEDMSSAKKELELFFTEILMQNRPLVDFIDPDFIYTTTEFAKRHYKIRRGPKKSGFHKIPIKHGHRHGGLLGMSATMTATSNGVDTELVRRGVWFLEHVIGRPPPPAPADVPALTPDTRGAKTPRDLLSMHRDEPNCYTCHQLIDPFGFAFENYSPVGRWREKWPKINRKIDPSSVLFDGTEITGPADLKKWMVDNIEIFGQCLAEKLITYALGRDPNYREKGEIKTVVQKNIANGEGFRDLIIDLVKTETFKGTGESS